MVGERGEVQRFFGAKFAGGHACALSLSSHRRRKTFFAAFALAYFPPAINKLFWILLFLY